MINSQSQLTLYVEEVINVNDTEAQEALDQAMRYMLCVATIQCDVTAPTLDRGHSRRLLAAATGMDVIINRTSTTNDTLLRNDTVVDFAAERKRRPYAVLNQSTDLAAALRAGLERTSLADRASHVHLGPTLYTHLGASVFIAYGAGGEPTAAVQDELLAALANVTRLEAILSSAGIASAVLPSSPALKSSSLLVPVLVQQQPMALSVRAPRQSMPSCGIACATSSTIATAIVLSSAAVIADVALSASLDSGGVLLPLVLGLFSRWSPMSTAGNLRREIPMVTTKRYHCSQIATCQQ